MLAPLPLWPPPHNGAWPEVLLIPLGAVLSVAMFVLGVRLLLLVVADNARSRSKR